MTPAMESASASGEDYYSIVALSNSGMKDLAVSAYRFWYLNVNPNRPVVEPTPELRLGLAVHCAILEPHAFDQRYAGAAVLPDVCLVTVDDCRQFLKDKGRIPKGTRKAELIAQVQDYDPSVPIEEVIVRNHATANAGKVIFKLEDWQRIAGMADALQDEPSVQQLLKKGAAEQAIFMKDPDTGVPLKGKLDWVAPEFTVDFKTFVQKRGKSINRSVADAIFYESYNRQAYFYAKLRGWPDTFCGDCVMVFVESEPPFECRIRTLKPKCGAQANLYWTRAMIETRGLIATYAECMKQFGTEKPWRFAQDIETLADEDIPALAWS